MKRRNVPPAAVAAGLHRQRAGLASGPLPEPSRSARRGAAHKAAKSGVSIDLYSPQMLDALARAGWCIVLRGGKFASLIHKSRVEALAREGDEVWLPPAEIFPNTAVLPPLDNSGEIVPNPAILDVPRRAEDER